MRASGLRNHPGDLTGGEAAERGRDEAQYEVTNSVKSPGVGGDAARHDALSGPWVSTRARPAVGEVVRPEDEDGDAANGQQQGSPEVGDPASYEPAPDGPEDRGGGCKAQQTKRDDCRRHDEHGPRRRHRVRRRPLPPDGELGPHGEREDDEDHRAPPTATRPRCSASSFVEGLTAEAGGGGPRHHATAGDIERSAQRGGPLLDVGEQAVRRTHRRSGPPFFRVPAKESTGPVADIRFRPPHAGPHVPARRRSPRSAIRRCAAKWSRSASAPTAVSL